MVMEPIHGTNGVLITDIPEHGNTVAGNVAGAYDVSACLKSGLEGGE